MSNMNLLINKIMKYLVSFLTLVSSFIFLSITAFAAPSISSYDDQSFEKNTSATTLNEITITDDAQTPSITASFGVKIQIPEDLSMIFDTNKTSSEFYLYGTAVDNDKIDRNPEISFEDSDKTIVIPVLEDFEAGESFTIRNFAGEGFNQTTTESQYLLLKYSEETEAIANTEYISIYTGTKSDSTNPDAPTNLLITQISNTSVKLTWTDPTDLDLFLINVLRGLNNSPISGTAYETVIAGIEEFLDEDLEVGNTIKYKLRGEDGLNLGDLTEEYSYTLIDMEAVPAEEAEEETVEEEVVEEEVVEEEAVEEETVTEEEIVETKEIKFEDIDGHWAEEYISELFYKGIVSGKDEKTFAPDEYITRAEISKIAVETFDVPMADTTGSFNDIANHWGSGYIEGLHYAEIVNGFPDGSFKPNNQSTRAETIKILLGAAGIDIESANVPEAEFLDFDQSQWHAKYINWVVHNKIATGYGDGNFGPNNNITRAEVSKIVSLMMAMQ